MGTVEFPGFSSFRVESLAKHDHSLSEHNAKGNDSSRVRASVLGENDPMNIHPKVIGFGFVVLFLWVGLYAEWLIRIRPPRKKTCGACKHFRKNKIMEYCSIKPRIRVNAGGSSCEDYLLEPLNIRMSNRRLIGFILYILILAGATGAICWGF